MLMTDESLDSFAEFARVAEPKLRRALVAAYGPEEGRDAAAEALAYAWEHWPQVSQMQNPAGYLYRVGQSRSRRTRMPLRRFDVFPAALAEDHPWIEPGLPAALSRLSERQRTAVVLVHGFGWTLREVADITGTSIPTIQKHVERGLRALRCRLVGAEPPDPADRSDRTEP